MPNESKPDELIDTTAPKPGNRPAEVGQAVGLLWVSLGIAGLNALIFGETLAAVAGATVGLLVVTTAVSIGISAGLTALIDQRKNWARITLMVLSVPGAAFWILSPQREIVFRFAPFSGMLTLTGLLHDWCSPGAALQSSLR